VAATFKKEKRNVIPRWRSFKDTVALGELEAPAVIPRQVPNEHYLSERLWDWSSNRTIWHAADLLATALVLRRPDVAVEAGEFLLSEPSAPPAARLLAQRLLRPNPEASIANFTEPDQEEIHAAIHRGRQRLTDDPRNAIQWIDLARNYTTLGLGAQAERAISVAVSLSNNNRFVLRTAARFYVHRGEADRAHSLIRNAPAVRIDPWLLAAEVALAGAADIPPRFAHVGRKMLQDRSMSPANVTELAGELATLELASGKVRSAKKLFHQSLVQPNENSLAQAEWAWDQLSGHKLDVDQYRVQCNFEAQAWHFFSTGEWEQALSRSKNWLNDQPFSHRPAVLATYIASTIFEDYQTSIDIANRSLVPNPDNPILLNNLAFAYAEVGNLLQAQRALDKVDGGNAAPADRVCLLATQGLIHYRQGLREMGRTFYRRAIELAAKEKLKRHHAEAFVHFALEEIRSHSLDTGEVVSAAESTADSFSDAGIAVLLERLRILRKEAAEKTEQNK
jgi:tetratricopeptide (TPR) repeat protein